MRGTNRSRATRLLVAMLAVMAAAGGQAAEPPMAPRLEFHRVHVPAGRLGAVRLGAERYVPMSIAEFEAAVARATDARHAGTVVMPRAVADAATYAVRLADDGMLVGLLACSISPATAAVVRALPLGPLVARRGTFTGASGSRDALIFGMPTAGSFMQTLESGTYGCEFVCPPVAAGETTFRLPLAASLTTTIELQLPEQAVPVVVGGAARHAVIIPPRGSDEPWRIEVGAADELGLTIQTQPTSPAGVAVWSMVEIRGQQAEFAATVRPSGPWSRDALVLDKDAAVRITSLTAGADDEPLEWTEPQDGRQIVVAVSPWLVGTRGDIGVRGVVPAVGPVWRLPLLTATQSRWSGGGSVVRIDPAFGVAAVEIDDCRIVTAAVADRWPAARGPDASGLRTAAPPPRSAVFNIEEQAAGATCRMTLRPRTPTFDVARVTTVEISPRALLGRSVCDIRVVDGEAFELTARLAPGWIPDSVELLDWADESAGGDAQPLRPVANAQPVEWRFVQSPGGDSLRIGLPLGATPARGIGLRISGHRAGIQPGAAFMTSDIDMVRFDGESAGTAMIDIKTVADSFMEVDDAPVGMVAVEGRLARLVEGGTIRGRISGGDLSPNRRARLVTRRPPFDATVAVRLEVRDDRLSEAFRFDCRPEAGGIETLVVDFSEAVGEGLEWLVASPEGVAVTARLLPPGDATALTAKRPESIAESWLLEFRPAIDEPVSIRATRTIPFAASVPVPQAWVREARAAEGTVTILSAGQLLPEVQNHRLLELPARLDGRASDARTVEFTYGPPPATAGPAAELRPADRSVDARAWAWREDVSFRCEESGLVECESRFEIENEGRDAVVITVPSGLRLQGVAVDGRSLPGDVVTAAGTPLRVPLPVAARRVELVVRSLLTPDPAVGWWQISPQGCGIDLPILARSIRLLLPPELEAVMADGGYRPADPVAASWLLRLWGIASTTRVDGRESRANETGFRAESFVARGSRDGGGIIVIRRRLISSACVLAALAAGASAFLMVPRAWSLAVGLCLVAALAAVWAPAPLYEIARAAWWAALAGSLCGVVLRRAAVALLVGASLVAPMSHAADPEPDSFRVFVTPGSGGEMALVPEALFRQLAGAGQAAADVRVVRCTVFVGQSADATPWRVELDVDADAGGTLLIEEDEGASWRPVDAAARGVLVRPAGNGVRLTASTAGRHRIELNATPRVERRGGLERAELRLPGAAAAAVHLVGDPLPANAVACERAALGQSFLPAPLVDPSAAAPVFDVTGAGRVRLLRPLDPRDRLATEPTAASTVNRVFWGLDTCTVQTTISLDAVDLLHAVRLRADERLERLEIMDRTAVSLQAVGPGRWLVELPRATRGKVEVRLESRMPLADPVGRFRVPAIWLDGLAGELRTVQVEASPDLDVAVDPPTSSGVTAAEFEAGAAPQVRVRRRRQQPRGVQNLAVTFANDRITLALRGQIDATTLAVTEIPLQVPPGCIIDRVALLEDDLAPVDGRPQPAVDIVWTRKATDRVVIVVQQPRAGRFRLVADARLRIRPLARGRVPLMRAEIGGGAPLIVSCMGEAAGGPTVRLATSAVRQAGAAESNTTVPTPELAEVFDDEPGPEYVLEPADVAPVNATAAPSAATSAGPAPGESRVELTDVFMAIDGRGRGRGAVRFDVATAEPTLLLRLPRGMRLYDLLVDGTQVPTVPRSADTWELRLHGIAWPRTILALFAGDVGPEFMAGLPISLPPPALVGLPAAGVLWTIEPPTGFEIRLAETARLLDAAGHAAARRAGQRRAGDRFDAALETADPRQQDRLRQLIDLRRGPGITGSEAAWQRAIGWPSATHADSGAAFARSTAATDLTLRAVRRADPTVPGRALATCGIVVAAGLAWRLAAWKAGRRRQAESDLARAADHR
ncbi:MAG: hypothetical protein RLZZ21_1672 [Planctomycetota bacterium]